MGSESAEAWRTVLDDLIKRGLRRPEFLIVDGAGGLEKAIAGVWQGVPVLTFNGDAPQTAEIAQFEAPVPKRKLN